MIPRRIVAWLVTVALFAPIGICVLLGIAWLLRGMSDVAGATVLGRIAGGIGVVWIIVLIALVIVQGINALASGEEPLE